MGSIKLYQTQDWIAAYLKSWGYEPDEALINALLFQMTDHRQSLQIEEISGFLNNYVLNFLNKIIPEICLPAEQKLAYFKMIFLMKKAYLKCQIFSNLSAEQEAYLQACLYNNLYQIVPDILQADMYRQSIKTYHPVWKIKKVIAKGLRRIFKRTKNKEVKTI